jgi:hypothetical protein
MLGFGENQQKEWISEETWKETESRKLAKENVNRTKQENRKLIHKHNTQKLIRVKKSIRKDKRNWINE